MAKSRGVRVFFLNIVTVCTCVFFSLNIFLTFTNSVDLDEMQHFIWVLTVCKSTCLGVSQIQRVNETLNSSIHGFKTVAE